MNKYLLLLKPTIIASLFDYASLNIRRNILEIDGRNIISQFHFKNKHLIDSIYETSKYRLILIKQENIYQDYIIFLSKHKSNSNIKAFTVHSTGNYGTLFYGGNNIEGLSIPYPYMMSMILQQLNKYNKEYNINININLEVTHHGPVKLSIPSFFVEIGSTIEEWKNKIYGEIVARSILNSLNKNNFNFSSKKIVVGFGGSHYANLPTKLTLNNKYYFGHIFPKYQILYLNKNIIKEAFIKSKTKYAYIDKKSISSNIKKELINNIESLGFIVINK